MIISRRKYERDIQEAKEHGRYEGEEKMWQRRRMDDIQDQVNRLTRRVDRLDPENAENLNAPVIG